MFAVDNSIMLQIVSIGRKVTQKKRNSQIIESVFYIPIANLSIIIITKYLP